MIFNGTAAKIAECVSVTDVSDISFFKPIKNSEKMLIRTVSIVTDAPILAISAVITVMIGCIKMLKAAGYLMIGDTSKSLNNLIEAGIGVGLGVFISVLTLISPALNLVDLLGGISTTLIGDCANEEDDADLHNDSLII